MVKKLSCGIVALLVISGIGLLTLAGFALLVCYGLIVVFDSPLKSSEARKHSCDPYYVISGGPDYCRLPLLKPYVLKSCFRCMSEDVAFDREISPEEFVGEEIVIPLVNTCNVSGNYFLAVSPAHEYLPSGYQNFWFILDMNNLKYKQFSVCKWGSGEVDIGNDTLKGAVFTSEKDFKRRLKKLGIDPEIKLYPPKYLYQKFLNTGRCPWFPEPDKPCL